VTPLGREIARLVAAEGPISVERYMALCLGHPVHGYYMTRDPFGASGDFVTAPEVSQMFGELVGLWCVDTWQRMGAPAPFRLVELGPGRGTLMADALRAARLVPAFLDAAQVHLVETSPMLRARQAATLETSGRQVAWHAAVEEVPDGPAIVVANEFFDALPLRQFVRTPRGWCERLVGLDAAGAPAFGLAAEPEPALRVPAPEGAVLEVAGTSARVMAALAARIAAQRGALLAIDYGHAGGGFGDTLQAVRRHAFVDVLADPGEADLTVHVDFAALARAAAGSDVLVHGPVTQGAFLAALGLAQRAAALARGAGPDGAAAVEAARRRLGEAGDGGMGDLFKVMAVTDGTVASAAGFDTPGRRPDGGPSRRIAQGDGA
jgi:NADH dehydrogenase [ubiquinone] 1 alpha subcomplex assembly factor 7